MTQIPNINPKIQELHGMAAASLRIEDVQLMFRERFLNSSQNVCATFAWRPSSIGMKPLLQSTLPLPHSPAQIIPHQN
jgi:hypothetical protein